jgi:hypothetical protein
MASNRTKSRRTIATKRRKPARKKKKVYRYVPPPADHRLFNIAKNYEGGVPDNLPTNIDLRPLCLPVRNQFINGPCTGFATAAFRELTWAVANNGQRLTEYLSPAFLYALTRQKEGEFPKVVDTSVADEF